MEIPSDPIMLYSCVNTWLRDIYPSLEAMCEDKDIDRDELLEKLSSVGFSYDREKNRFS